MGILEPVGGGGEGTTRRDPPPGKRSTATRPSLTGLLPPDAPPLATAADAPPNAMRGSRLNFGVVAGGGSYFPFPLSSKKTAI